MHPVLFHVGKIPIHTYSILLSLGLAVAVLWLWWRGREEWGPEAGGWVIDGVLAAAVGGILGGRAAYVGANWSYYHERLYETWALWRGGLSFLGAFAGGVIAVTLYWAWRQKAIEAQPSFWEVADLASPALALGGFFGWAACLASGVAYGSVGTSPISYLLPDAYGIEAVRFATQPLGILLSLGMFALLLILKRQVCRPGVLFATYLLLYCGGLALLEGMRGDETLYLKTWRTGQVASLALAGAGLLLLLYLRRSPGPPRISDGEGTPGEAPSHPDANEPETSARTAMNSLESENAGPDAPGHQETVEE